MLAIQSRSNRQLQAALSREHLALNDASYQSNQAEKAIDSLYIGITEDVILRRPELEQLRRRLLGAALSFYDERVKYLSEKTTAGKIDPIRHIAAGLIESLHFTLLGERTQPFQHVFGWSSSTNKTRTWTLARRSRLFTVLGNSSVSPAGQRMLSSPFARSWRV